MLFSGVGDGEPVWLKLSQDTGDFADASRTTSIPQLPQDAVAGRGLQTGQNAIFTTARCIRLTAMAGIFINYRRDDAPGVAGRLFDYLAGRFSREDLFMDVDAMKPGVDFAKQLDAQVSHCRVLLAVIGPHWLDTKDKTGARRLDNEKDYVRIELASALKRDIAVIPVLVDGATMPPAESLADDLKPLAFRHALELRHSRFSADADAIVHALESAVPRRRNLMPLIGAAVAAVLVVAAGGVMWAKLKKPAVPPAVQTSAVVATAPPAASLPAPVAPSPAAPATPAPAPAAPAPAAPPPAASAPSPQGLPRGIKLGEIMPNVALRGSLYRATDIADPSACQAACRAETRCVSWTYSQPKPNETAGRCALKAVIPQQFADSCCTSAVERVPDPELQAPPPIPAGVTGALAGVELEGGSYKFFPDATIEGCQSACRADSQCMAWDYVRPGIFSTDARCYLKNKPSMQVQSPCCVAGFERQAGASPVTPAPAPVPAPAAASPAPPALANASADTGLPAGVKLGAVIANVTMPGSVSRTIDVPQGSTSACQAACRSDNSCVAWTLALGASSSSTSRCALKPVIPQQVANVCCSSGIERVPPAALREPPAVPAGMTGAMRGVDLFGGDLHGVGGSPVTPQSCQAACRSETECIAWTYVRAGVVAGDARCALKSRTSQQVTSPCCISGTK